MGFLQKTKYDWLGAALFGVVLAAISWRCYQRLRPANNPTDESRSAMADFQDVVYWPTRAAMTGVNPYDSRPAAEGGAYHSQFPAGNNFPVYAPSIFFLS